MGNRITQLLCPSIFPMEGDGLPSNWKDNDIIGRKGWEVREKLQGIGDCMPMPDRPGLECHLCHSPAGSLTSQSLYFLSSKMDQRKTLPNLLTGFHEDNMNICVCKMGFTACEGVKM